jgi:hypothetical protein
MSEHERSAGAQAAVAIVGVLGIVFVIIVASCAGLGLVYRSRIAVANAEAQAIAGRLAQGPVPPAPAATPPQVPAAITSGPHDQPLASGDLVVRITLVSRSKVPFKTTTGEGELNGKHLLVRLSVVNTSQSSTVDFLAWNQPNDRIGPYAMLADDAGNTYKRVDFGLGSKVLGLEPEQTIEPGQAVEAALAFEPPVDSAKNLILVLPCKALGTPGVLRFEIPVDAVSNE